MVSQRKQDPVVWILGVLCLGARVGCGIFLFIWIDFYGYGREKSAAAPSSGSHDVSSISA
jgi:hypothetical protein